MRLLHPPFSSIVARAETASLFLREHDHGGKRVRSGRFSPNSCACLESSFSFVSPTQLRFSTKQAVVQLSTRAGCGEYPSANRKTGRRLEGKWKRCIIPPQNKVGYVTFSLPSPLSVCLRQPAPPRWGGALFLAPFLWKAEGSGWNTTNHLSPRDARPAPPEGERNSGENTVCR